MKKFVILDRILAYLHVFVLFTSVYLPIASFYGIHSGDEMGRILKILIISPLMLIPIILGDLLGERIHNMFLYMGIGIAVSFGVAKAGAVYTSRFADPLTNEIFGISAVSFLLSLVVFITNARAYIKKTQDEWGYSDEQKKQEESDVQVGKMAGATFLNTPDVRHTLVFIFPYVLAVFAKHEAYVRMLFIFAVIDVFLLFADFITCAFVNFMYKNRRSSNMPVQFINRMVAAMIGVGCGLIILFMLPSILMGGEPLLNKDFSQKNYATTDFRPIESAMRAEESAQQAERIDFRDLYVDETPQWVRDFQKIMWVICTIAVIIMAIAGVVIFIKNSAKAFSQRSQTNDEVEFLDTTRGDIKSATRIFAKGEENIFSPAKQIRNRYKKLIKKKAKGQSLLALTPSQLEEAAGLEESEIRRELHSIYEKARYSKAAADSEDLKRLRQLKI